jgi:hypothetical protein
MALRGWLAVSVVAVVACGRGDAVPVAVPQPEPAPVVLIDAGPATPVATLGQLPRDAWPATIVGYAFQIGPTCPPCSPDVQCTQCPTRQLLCDRSDAPAWADPPRSDCIDVEPEGPGCLSWGTSPRYRVQAESDRREGPILYVRLVRCQTLP